MTYFGLDWLGLAKVWFCLVRRGLGTVWIRLAFNLMYGLIRFNMVWCSMVWFGSYGLVYGSTRFSMV